MLFFPTAATIKQVNTWTRLAIEKSTQLNQQVSQLPALARSVDEVVRIWKQQFPNAATRCNIAAEMIDEINRQEAVNKVLTTAAVMRQYEILCAIVDYTIRSKLEVINDNRTLVTSGFYDWSMWHQITTLPQDMDIFRTIPVAGGKTLPKSSKRLLERIVKTVKDPKMFKQAWSTYLAANRKIRCPKK